MTRFFPPLRTWPLLVIALCAAAGATSASAQSRPEAATGEVSAIDIPEPRRITISTRRVERGEIAIADPIALEVAPDRPIPRPTQISEPLSIATQTERRLPAIVEMPNPFDVIVEMSRESPPNGPEVRSPDRIDLGAMREEPSIPEINEPFSMAFGARRNVLPVAVAKVAIAACDFDTIREELRRLVGVSDQLDSAGRRVVAELSRLNRANTAFETARDRYEQGKLDESEELLQLARGIDCPIREAKIVEILNKVERFKTVLARIDTAIASCSIPAMKAMQAQLAGQTHRLLVERKVMLDAMSVPGSSASEKSRLIEAALRTGELEKAESLLADAEKDLAALPDPAVCPDLRKRIADQSAERGRVSTFVNRADAAIASCDIDTMSELSLELASDSNEILLNKGRRLANVAAAASAARSFLGGAERLYRIGRFDGAIEMIESASTNLERLPQDISCPALAQNVADRTAAIEKSKNLCSGANDNIARATKALEGGEIEQAVDLLTAAQREFEQIPDETRCAEAEERITRRMGEAERLRSLVERVDTAVEACAIEDMRNLALALVPEKNILLARKQREIAAIAAQASAAKSFLGGASHLFRSGQLSRAESMLGDAESRLSELPSPDLCSDLRSAVNNTQMLVERSKALCSGATDKIARADATLSKGDLDAASTLLNAAQGELGEIPEETNCAEAEGIISGRLAEVERLKGLLNRANQAIAACAIEDMRDLALTLLPEDNVGLSQKRDEIATIASLASGTQAFLGGADRLFQIGQLDESESMLKEAADRLGSLPNQDLCLVLRDAVATQSRNLDGLRTQLAATSGAINVCTPDDLQGALELLADGDHPLIRKQRDTVGRVSEKSNQARNLVETAAARFAEGNMKAAEARLQDAVLELDSIKDATACSTIRAKIALQRSEIEEIKRQLAAADGAVQACDAPAMRQIASALEGQTHILLTDKRRSLLALSEPISDAKSLNNASEAHYFGGRLDDAGKALRTAQEKLSTIETCGPLKAQIARRLDRVRRLDSVRGRIDSAVAQCNIPAMTAMAGQLKGQDHRLLVDAANRIAKVNGPATAAKQAISKAQRSFEAGNLDSAGKVFNEAQEILSGIEAGLCADIRSMIAERLDRIAYVSDTLARADEAVDTCDLPLMTSIKSEIKEEKYSLLVRSRDRLASIIAPLAEATEASRRAEPLFKNGELDKADSELKRVNAALGQISGDLCPTVRQSVAETERKIAAVRSLMAEADRAMEACDLDLLVDLPARLEANGHKLLASKSAELSDFAAPVNAARNLGETAKTLYFEGNFDGAETRLNNARKELSARPACAEANGQVNGRLARVAKMRSVLERIDRAISQCNIPAMTAFGEQLTVQSHPVLKARKQLLDQVNDPALAARILSDQAWPLFEAGHLVAAETRLRDAAGRLDDIDPNLCLSLRDEIADRREEVDRVQSTLILVENAISACNHRDIDLMAANLATAQHVSLQRALEDLQAGRARCGMSADEKFVAAQEACSRQHPNSVVAEFDAATGRHDCVCPENYDWDSNRIACVSQSDFVAAASNACLRAYPNSRAVNVRSAEQFECNCQEGYVWNADESACITADEVLRIATAACARDGGYPVEIESASRFVCCPNGSTWDPNTRTCQADAPVPAAEMEGEKKPVEDTAGKDATAADKPASQEPADDGATPSSDLPPPAESEGMLDKIKRLFGKFF